jgi:hypothetical protein
MNNNFQIDLTEAFAKLNQVPLVVFTSDENPNKDNFLYIYIRMTGKLLSFYHFYYAFRTVPEKKFMCSYRLGC